MPVPVVADADTLFGGSTRGLLINLDYAGVIRLHWSALILDEMSRALVTTGRKKDVAAARAHEQLMRDSLPNAELPVMDVQRQFAAVVDGVRSAKDMHVAATAQLLLAGQYYPSEPVVSLVSRNVTDFKVKHLAAMAIRVQRPDAFLKGLVGTRPQEVSGAFRAFRLSLSSQPTSAKLLDRLTGDGQAETALALGALEQSGAVQL